MNVHKIVALLLIMTFKSFAGPDIPRVGGDPSYSAEDFTQAHSFLKALEASQPNLDRMHKVSDHFAPGPDSEENRVLVEEYKILMERLSEAVDRVGVEQNPLILSPHRWEEFLISQKIVGLSFHIQDQIYLRHLPYFLNFTFMGIPIPQTPRIPKVESPSFEYPETNPNLKSMSEFFGVSFDEGFAAYVALFLIEDSYRVVEAADLKRNPGWRLLRVFFDLNAPSEFEQLHGISRETTSSSADDFGNAIASYGMNWNFFRRILVYVPGQRRYFFRPFFANKLSLLMPEVINNLSSKSVPQAHVIAKGVLAQARESIAHSQAGLPITHTNHERTSPESGLKPLLQRCVRFLTKK